MPEKVQKDLIDKKMKFYVIDAYKVADETGMGVRINTIMQTCFFAISNIFPKEEAIEMIKNSIKKTYGAKGDKIVQMNFNAVDQTLENLFEVNVPAKVTSKIEIAACSFRIMLLNLLRMLLRKLLPDMVIIIPVSKMPIDGTFPTEQHNGKKEISHLKFLSGMMKFVFNVINVLLFVLMQQSEQKYSMKKNLKDAPATFKSTKFKAKDYGEGL